MLTLTHVPHRPQVWRTAESEAADTLTVQYEHKTKKNKDFSWKSENKDWSLYFFSYRLGEVEWSSVTFILSKQWIKPHLFFVPSTFNIRKEHRWILLLSFKAGLPSLMVVLSPPLCLPPPPPALKVPASSTTGSFCWIAETPPSPGPLLAACLRFRGWQYQPHTPLASCRTSKKRPRRRRRTWQVNNLQLQPHTCPL